MGPNISLFLKALFSESIGIGWQTTELDSLFHLKEEFQVTDKIRCLDANHIFFFTICLHKSMLLGCTLSARGRIQQYTYRA